MNNQRYIKYISLSNDYLYNLNINHLHDIIDIYNENGHISRRSGKTMALVSLMVGSAELGEVGNKYLYIGASKEFSLRVRSEFRNILQHFGFLTICIQENMLLVNTGNGNKSFTFAESSSIKHERFSGNRYDDVYIDADINDIEMDISLITK